MNLRYGQMVMIVPAMKITLDDIKSIGILAYQINSDQEDSAKRVGFSIALAKQILWAVYTRIAQVSTLN